MTTPRRVPENATEIVRKDCDAVAYLYTRPNGLFSAMIFWGKQAKPAVEYAVRSEADLAQHLADHFAQRAEYVAFHKASIARRRAARA